jgi:3-oxoacyl-[acyl-carrier protein] reductase
MKLLEGKVALITGASRGIGNGIAKKFAEMGADVAFTYLSSEEKARALEEELKAFGVRAKGYKSDAAKYSEAETLIDSIVADFGTLEIVVNNAGITRDTLLLRMTEEQWDQVIDTNLKSVFNITKNAVKVLMKNRKGSIINITSIVGRNGNPGQANYSASKAGVIGFTQVVAKEMGSRGVRCNAIAPGFIATEMTGELSEEVIKGWNDMIPMKRPGTPEDVANLAVFLGSDMSGYINGQTINVCGGLHTPN